MKIDVPSIGTFFNESKYRDVANAVLKRLPKWEDVYSAKQGKPGPTDVPADYKDYAGLENITIEQEFEVAGTAKKGKPGQVVKIPRNAKEMVDDATRKCCR